MADDRGAAGVRRPEGVEQGGDGTRSNSSQAVIEMMSERGQPVEPVLHGDRDAGVGAQHARRLADQREVERGRPMCAAVVAEDLGADAEPEAADETVGDDDAHDQRTTVLSHADIMAEKLR